MVTLKFYGGVSEIGGTKILIDDGGEGKFFLDFGRSFSKERDYFDPPFLQPREERHLLCLNILPEITGFYRQAEGESGIKGILISHAHTDHFDYVRYVKDSVPLYCGETTREIIIAREFMGQPPSRQYAIAGLSSTDGEWVKKKFITFRTGNRFSLGSIEVEPVHVDHSIPGAYGYILRTEDGNIVYTGDFRIHGTHPELTLDFIERAEEANPKVLLIEGTSLLGGKLSSEEEVFNKALQIIRGTGGLVLVSFSPVDVDRLRTFYQVARETGRVLAISTRQAFYIDRLLNDPHLEIFSPEDSHVMIYAKGKEKPRAWEKYILSKYHSQIIEAEEISKSQGSLILVYSYYDMNEMEDISPQAGSVFILSQSEPFNEEMELDYQKLLNWLEHYGIPLYNVHASGHAAPFQLKETIEKISPEKVIPIHTVSPQLFKKFISDLNMEVVVPNLGGEYQLH